MMKLLSRTTPLLIAMLCLCTSTLSNALADNSKEYLLGVGDVVGIDVRNMGQQEYGLDGLSIPATGRLSLPLVGAVQFLDRTTDQLELLISQRLSEGYLNKPEVTINVVEYRPFFIRGGVNTPGAFQFQFNMTVEKAIAVAGGISNRGSLDGIVIVTEKDKRKIDADNLGERVRPGDVITVPIVSTLTNTHEAEQEVVYLYGEVKSPGGYRFHSGLTVEKAIALAGGFSDRGSKKKLSIKRLQENNETTVFKKVPLTEPVLPGDVVTVGQSYF